MFVTDADETESRSGTSIVEAALDPASYQIAFR